MFITYILYSEKSNKFSIGHTINLDTVLNDHNSSLTNNNAFKLQPWTLKLAFTFKSRSLAMYIEKYLRKKPNEFLFNIISNVELQDHLIQRFK